MYAVRYVIKWRCHIFVLKYVCISPIHSSLQLLASVATWLGNSHTWRRARRSSRGWRTPRSERPSGRGRDFHLKCEHQTQHTLSCDATSLCSPTFDRCSDLPSSPTAAPSEMGEPDSPAFETMFQPAETPGQSSYNIESPAQTMDRPDDFSQPGTTESGAEQEN